MRIVIAGGGLAGLAAAVALTERGLSCEVLESRPRLGGRASSFLDPVSGMSIDNCQHVSLGCCTNFRHFCETTGLAEFFRREDCSCPDFFNRTAIARVVETILPSVPYPIMNFQNMDDARAWLMTGDLVMA